MSRKFIFPPPLCLFRVKALSLFCISNCPFKDISKSSSKPCPYAQSLSQGLASSSENVNLSVGYFYSIPLINFCAETLIGTGNSNSPLKISSCNSDIFGALKGTVPESIANRSTPRLQISTKKPS